MEHFALTVVAFSVHFGCTYCESRFVGEFLQHFQSDVYP